MQPIATENRGRFGFGGFLLFVLAVLGIVLIVYRYATGIGSVANLNQGYPWGFWIGFDVLAGIALAGGAFVVAGLVHIFGGEKYHPLVRPAILTAFLGYLLFIFALLIDLGRPWMIWSQMINWHHESPMFEVGWCVMMYTTVLFLEFLPVVFERFKLRGLHALWKALGPWIIVAMIMFFTFVMTDSMTWVLIIGAALVLFQLMVLAGVLHTDPKVPTLLIMAGIIFSTLHQSSLGTLFLMVPHKLSAIWYSPLLPIQFFLSAVMAGLAMIIVEANWSGWFFKRKPETDLLVGMGRGLTVVMLIYLALKVVDLVVRGAAPEVLATSNVAIAFWIEIVVGLLIPLAFLMTPELARSGKGLFWAALFVVIGLIINRINVAVTGISAPAGPTYYPHWMEIAITAGVVSLGILAFVFVCRFFPIFEEHEHTAKA
ncbi:MAG: Ni/Fe-hydrogenase cytochrome b subunit [Planctomycetes bacterium]|nr:Ni/Fe-hydrogenase cytochrome b subunit [Planctomycetota bacterium]